MTGKFATAINCMDGRAQRPVIDYIQENFGIDYVDMITEPGPNRIVAENKDSTVIESLKKRVTISVEKHHSQHILIVGHHDCAGNPVDEAEQKKHLLKAVDVVASWNFPVKEIIAIWLDENFKPNVIS